MTLNLCSQLTGIVSVVAEKTRSNFDALPKRRRKATIGISNALKTIDVLFETPFDTGFV